MTATNKMTKATSDTTKLNFITDQGSSRATVRCACRAVRFGCFAVALGFAPRDAARLSAAALSVPPDGGAALSGGGLLPDVPDRRNVRAGDDGECAGGSGISHANAAGETEGGSACAGRLLAGEAEAAGEARPEAGAAPAPEVVLPAGSSAG